MEEVKKESSPFSMSHVIDLLTHFNIISEIKKVDGSHVYFMPCLLLPDPDVGKEKKQTLRDMDPAPLLILFSTGYIPLGLFSALVVYLSNLHSWVVDPYERRYRNKVCFEVDGSTDLVLMSHVDCLELRIFPPEDCIPASKCINVVSVIKKAVEDLKSCHPYKKFDNQLGFYCSSSLEEESGTPHHAVCWETAKPEACWNQVLPEYMRCPRKCSRGRSRLLLRHKVWFDQVHVHSCTSLDHNMYELYMYILYSGKFPIVQIFAYFEHMQSVRKLEGLKFFGRHTCMQYTIALYRYLKPLHLSRCPCK